MKVGILYGHIATNLGDLIINEGLLNLLNNLDIQIHMVFFNPNEVILNEISQKLLGKIDSYKIFRPTDIANIDILFEYFSDLKKVLDETGLTECDKIIFNSGEHLFFNQDAEHNIDILWRLLPLFAAQLNGKKTILAPSTVGPFNGSIYDKFLSSILNMFDEKVSRDSVTTKLLKSQNIKNVNEFLDPAFFYFKDTQFKTTEVNTLALVVRLENFGKRIGNKKSKQHSQLYKESNYTNSSAYELSERIINDFCAVGKNKKIKIFIQTLADKHLANSLYETSEFKEQLEVCYPNNIEEYIKELSGVNAVIASRFHACIIAMSLGIPSYGLHYYQHGHKMTGLFQLLEISENCINVNNGDVKTIVQNINNFFNFDVNKYNKLHQKIVSLKSQELNFFTNILLEDKEKKDLVDLEIVDNFIKIFLEEKAIYTDTNYKNIEKKLIAEKEKEQQKAKAELEQLQAEKEKEQQKAKAELEQLQAEKEKEQQKAKAELEQLQAEKEKEQQKAKAELEQLQAEKEKEQQKAKAELEQLQAEKEKEQQKAKAELEQLQAEKEKEQQKAKAELEQLQAEKEKEQQKAKAELEQLQAEKEKEQQKAKAELEQLQAEKEKEQQKAKAELEQLQAEKEKEQQKAKAELEQLQAEKEKEQQKAKAELEQLQAEKEKEQQKAKAELEQLQAEKEKEQQKAKAELEQLQAEKEKEQQKAKAELEQLQAEKEKEQQKAKAELEQLQAEKEKEQQKAKAELEQLQAEKEKEQQKAKAELEQLQAEKEKEQQKAKAELEQLQAEKEKEQQKAKAELEQLQAEKEKEQQKAKAELEQLQAEKEKEQQKAKAELEQLQAEKEKEQQKAKAELEQLQAEKEKLKNKLECIEKIFKDKELELEHCYSYLNQTTSYLELQQKKQKILENKKTYLPFAKRFLSAEEINEFVHKSISKQKYNDLESYLIEIESLNATSSEKAKILNEVAQDIKDNQREISVALMEKALEYDFKIYRLKWLAFRYLELKELTKAKVIFSSIQERTEFSISENKKYREFIQTNNEKMEDCNKKIDVYKEKEQQKAKAELEQLQAEDLISTRSDEIKNLFLAHNFESAFEKTSVLQNLSIEEKEILNTSSNIINIKKELEKAQYFDKIDPIRNKIVVFLHGSLPYQSGGYATRAHGVISQLIKQGFDVKAYTRPNFPQDIKSEFKNQKFDSPNIIDDVEYYITSSDTKRKPDEFKYIFAMADIFEEVLRKEKPQFVHARSTYLISIPALIAAKRVGIPLVYEISGLWEIVYESRDDAKDKLLLTSSIRYMETLVANHAQKVFTLTEAMKEEMIHRGVDSEKIILTPNCVNTEQFQKSQPNMSLKNDLGFEHDTKIIGYVGSFVDYEGLDDLIKAFEMLKRDNLNVGLLLIGDGAEYNKIQKLASDSEYSKSIILTGRIPFEEVKNYYSIIDICPFPRKAWPVCEMVSPMKPFESLAMGKPIVVSSVRALEEIVSGNDIGLVFEKNNIDSLKEKLELLITDVNFYKFYSSNTRKWVENNRSWDGVGKILKQEYISLMDCFIEDLKNLPKLDYKLVNCDLLKAHFENLKKIKEVDYLENGYYTVFVNNTKFDFFLSLKNNGILFVLLSGAIDPNNQVLPIFNIWKWHNRFPGNVINISDPTFNLTDAKIPCGWYIGNKEVDIMQETKELIETISEKLRVSKIILYGSSAGGFASMKLASKLENSLAIAINPQTDILKYNRQHALQFIRLMFNKNSFDLLSEDELLRMNVFDENYNINSKCLYVQNIQDTSHYYYQYLPFIDKFKSSSNIKKLEFSSSVGHGPEIGRIVNDIIQQGIKIVEQVENKA